MGAPKFKNMEEKIYRYVRNDKNGCWVWTGARSKHGYGTIRHGKNRGAFLAHRLSYAIFKEPPKGLVLHKCDNRACVNPEHLFEGTHQDNMRDMVEKGRSRGLVGEEHNMAKIFEANVIEMRRLRKAGATYKQLGKKYGITTQGAYRAITGITWKHVKEGL